MISMKKEQPKELKFPCLMISSRSGTVILASSADKDTGDIKGMAVVESADGSTSLGEMSDTWRCNPFTEYLGCIVLASDETYL